MTGAVIQKVCRLCGQDCAHRPRTKDRHGRYFCSECYDRAIARQRRLRGTTPSPPSSPSLSPPQAPPKPPIEGVTISSAVRSPPMLPSHAALLLPPASAPVATPNGESAHAASTTVENPSPPTLIESPAIVDSPATADAARQPFEVNVAPDIDVERPAATVTDAHESESHEHETSPATSLELTPDDSGAFVAPAREPSLEQASQHTPALSVAPEPERVEPSLFELEPEQQEGLVFAEGTAPEQHEPATSDAFTAVASSPASPVSPAVARAAQAPRAPLHLSERRQTALDTGPLPAAFVACPHCGRPMPTGAVICLACGFNTMNGVRCDDDVARPITRRRARSGWTGPILVATTLTLLALGGGYLLLGTRTGVLAYGIALAIGVPAWFAWALLDARDTEGAQLKIWLVPGYIIAWVFGESRSRYLRAATVALSVAAIAFTAMAYQWRQQERQGDRPALDRRAGAVTTDPSFP